MLPPVADPDFFPKGAMTYETYGPVLTGVVRAPPSPWIRYWSHFTPPVNSLEQVKFKREFTHTSSSLNKVEQLRTDIFYT